MTISSEFPSIILLTTPSTIEFVKSVAGKLSTQFALTRCIFIRCGMISSSRLLEQEKSATSTTTNYKKLLYILFEATANLSCLMVESQYPVLILDSYTKNSNSNKNKENGTVIMEAALCIAKFCSLSYTGSNDTKKLNDTIVQCLTGRRQSAIVDDATMRTESPAYLASISQCYDNNLQITGTNILVQGQPGKRGKVRDRFEQNEISSLRSLTTTKQKVIALVTTDRQSGFDRQLALVPYKGAVLNLCSSFWFEQTSDIIPNHLIATPHPYVSIVKQCQPFPIEFVVRYVKIKTECNSNNYNNNATKQNTR